MIKINKDRIEINGYSITNTADGIEINGNFEYAGDILPPPPMSGTVAGYTSGGTEPPYTNVIDKFQFATDANATDVGDLTQARRAAAGQSSTENGYTSGGQTPPNVNTIDKFPFAADANATDVGDLTQAKHSGAGQQD